MDSNLEIFRGNPWDVNLNTTLEPLCPPPPCPRPVTPPYPCSPLPPYPVEPPGPEPEVPAFITKLEKYWYDHAFINVPTIDDLKSLENDDLYDGKLVKVDNVGGTAKFYEWDESTHTWNEYMFATDIIPISDEEIYEICGVVP